jgi:F-type H+-transporting ATPase subunit b
LSSVWSARRRKSLRSNGRSTRHCIEERQVSYLYEAEFWVAVAFVIFVALLWRVGAHRSLVDALDDRSKRIAAELAEARRLREEAAALLEEYRRKAKEAESEAAAILELASSEAAEIATETKKRMEEFVARRTKMAEGKIAQAETQALADVRAAAADAAVRAAEKILADTVKGKTAEGLLETAIRDVKARLD